MRVLISRLGGIGDCLIVTPLIRYLKKRGDEVCILTSEQGDEIYRNNPHISKLKVHERDSVPNNALDDYFESFRQAWECDKHIGLSESIEVNVALYPSSPRYKYPLYERRLLCDENYYNATFKFAGVVIGFNDWITPYDLLKEGFFDDLFKSEMFFTEAEEKDMRNFFSHYKDKFVIVWALSGSQKCKTYPYVHSVVNQILQTYKDAVVVTIGDQNCQILETPFNDKRVIKKSGVWSIRQSILACKYASLVISPDTGILHGSGCFDTPKIGLLTHTTIKNITDYFKNDYSIECDHQLVTCSPCFQLHYSSNISCQYYEDGFTPLCMAVGIPVEKILSQTEKVRATWPGRS